MTQKCKNHQRVFLFQHFSQSNKSGLFLRQHSRGENTVQRTLRMECNNVVCCVVFFFLQLEAITRWFAPRRSTRARTERSEAARGRRRTHDILGAIHNIGRQTPTKAHQGLPAQDGSDLEKATRWTVQLTTAKGIMSNHNVERIEYAVSKINSDANQSANFSLDSILSQLQRNGKKYDDFWWNLRWFSCSIQV